MTAAALTPSAEYIEDGVTLDFPAPFRFLSGAHLEVKRITAAGVVNTLAFGSAWTASGGNSDAGGTVTLAATVAGATIKIRRVTPRTQQTDYQTNDTFPAETHEAALDRLTLIDQEQDVLAIDTATRSLLVPEGEAATTLPPAADRRGKFLGFSTVDGAITPVDGTDANSLLAADLASTGAGKGAALVGFLPDGTGAVPQSVFARARQEMFISDFLPAGFVTTGGIDYSIPLQKAIYAAAAFDRTLHWINGIFDVSGTGLTVPHGLNVQGQGQYTSILRNQNGNAIRIGTELATFKDMFLISEGGHTVVQTDHAGRNNFERVAFLQGSTGFSVWDNAGFNFIRHVFTDCYAQHLVAATVPTFNLVGPGGGINNNIWTNHWAQECGNYHINIETTDTNAQYGNVVEHFVGEVLAGGGIRMAGAKLFVLEDIHCWDVSLAPGGELIKDFISIERGNAGAYPDGERATSIGKIDSYTRLDSPIASGVFDIDLPDGGGGANIQIGDVSSASDVILINLAGNFVWMIVNEGSLTLSNRSNATTYDPVTGRWRLPSAAQIEIGGNKVVGSRVTGFGGVVGTANKAAIATYSAPAISNPPTQAQVQALANAMQETSQRLKAESDASFAHGLIGA